MTEPKRVSKNRLALYQDFKEVFGSDAGKRVLDHLKRDYSGGCFIKGDLYATLHLSSLRDFVDYIVDMVEGAEGPFDLSKRNEMYSVWEKVLYYVC